ncbi:hypothetical protein [Alkalicoccus daliensis]|uniref:hypothetical protein n=1 Tax=Alkalicoccus daliensis TaxID=745820 RepID=UPI000B82F4DE|nr:hypothetical protein [Alkalicoccus daliensis]
MENPSDLLEGHEARAESILVFKDSMAVSVMLSVDRWKPCPVREISREQALEQASPKVKQQYYFFLAELLFSR